MRFRIDLKIFIFLILFYFTKQIELYATIMVFCMIHELGHLIAGVLLGMKLEKIEIMPFGLSISFKLYPKDYNKKIGKGNLLEIKKLIVAVAGPIVNFIMILIFSKFQLGMISKETAIYSNVLILIFNLIPIYPLDGGRILKSILNILIGRKKSRDYTNSVSNIIAVILTVISSIAIYYFKNIAILVIISFIWTLVIKENKVHKQITNIYELVGKCQ